MTWEEVFEKYGFNLEDNTIEDDDSAWVNGELGVTPYYTVAYWRSNGFVIRQYKTVNKETGRFILGNNWAQLEIDTTEKLDTLLGLLFPLER